MNYPESAWVEMGKPALHDVEMRIQALEAEYRNAPQAEKDIRIRLVERAIDVYAWLEGRDIISLARSGLRPVNGVVQELKKRLTASEQIRIARDHKHIYIAYETLDTTGKPVETHTSLDAWAFKRKPELDEGLVEGLAKGEKKAVAQIVQRCKEFTRKHARLGDVRSLASEISNCLAVGCELAIREGKANLAVANTAKAKGEYRYRLQAIKRGEKTKISNQGNLVMNGHIVSTFAPVKVK